VGGIEQLIEDWDGTAVVQSFDRDTGTWIFVALHDASLGTPAGGTRIKVYPRPEDGLLDALRLSAGMTHKWASIGVPFGGGKAVLALSRELAPDERQALLRRYAKVLSLVAGGFLTGQDLGSTPEDMAFLAQETESVLGVDPETRAIRDPGPYTALGVFVCMQAACEVRFGAPDLEGRSVLVQGVGDVGGPLARRIAAAGGTVLISDLDVELARSVAAEVGGRVVSAEEVPDTECDVYAPCAVGATVNAETIPRLRCRIVVGSANNQLREEADAQRLHDRGILYAPDYVVNAGGAAAFSLIAAGTTDEATLRSRVEELHAVCLEILTAARERGESPLESARRRVERALRGS